MEDIITFYSGLIIMLILLIILIFMAYISEYDPYISTPLEDTIDHIRNKRIEKITNKAIEDDVYMFKFVKKW